MVCVVLDGNSIQMFAVVSMRMLIVAGAEGSVIVGGLESLCPLELKKNKTHFKNVLIKQNIYLKKNTKAPPAHYQNEQLYFIVVLL